MPGGVFVSLKDCTILHALELESKQIKDNKVIE